MKNSKMLMVGVLGLAFGVVSQVKADVVCNIDNKSAGKIEYKIIVGDDIRNVKKEGELDPRTSIQFTDLDFKNTSLVIQYSEKRDSGKKGLFGNKKFKDVWMNRVYTIKNLNCSRNKLCVINFRFQDGKISLTNEDEIDHLGATVINYPAGMSSCRFNTVGREFEENPIADIVFQPMNFK